MGIKMSSSRFKPLKGNESNNNKIILVLYNYSI